MNRNATIREYRNEPCPICGQRGWCGRREDRLVLCKRPPNPPEVTGYVYKGLAGDSVTAMFVETGQERRQAGGQPSVPRAQANQPPVSPAALEATHTAAVAALTPELRTGLAVELGLSASVLPELAIGWSDTARHHADYRVTGAYVLPEYDGQGRLIGVSYRFAADRVADLTDADGKPLGS